jgi:hypothetical protein
MRIKELVIEITRKCNAACPHCMRGPAQTRDMAFDTITAMLNGITQIDMVTFTGGEPSLAVDRIRYFHYQIHSRNIKLGGFYVITNGKYASIDLVTALDDLYDDTTALDDLYDDTTDGNSVLTVSKDAYHKDKDPRTESLYSTCSYYRPEGFTYEIPVKEGRSQEGREAFLNPVLVTEGYIEGTVYVNALGDVITSCEMSYDTQKINTIGNVNKESLYDIITHYLERT